MAGGKPIACNEIVIFVQATHVSPQILGSFGERHLEPLSKDTFVAFAQRSGAFIPSKCRRQPVVFVCAGISIAESSQIRNLTDDSRNP